MNAPQQPRTFCYDEPAKKAQSQAMRRFYRAAQKWLQYDFKFKVHFNPGGVAVWGETYAKISLPSGEPVVEAYDTSMGLLVRQWDGRNSGANHYVHDLDAFVRLVSELASKPFVRF